MVTVCVERTPSLFIGPFSSPGLSSYCRSVFTIQLIDHIRGDHIQYDQSFNGVMLDWCHMETGRREDTRTVLRKTVSAVGFAERTCIRNLMVTLFFFSPSPIWRVSWSQPGSRKRFLFYSFRPFVELFPCEDLSRRHSRQTFVRVKTVFKIRPFTASHTALCEKDPTRRQWEIAVGNVHLM